MSTQINTYSNWRERKQEQQESSHFKSNIMQQSPSLYLLFSFALSHARFFCLLCSILAPNRNSLYLIKNPATDFPYRPSTNLPSGRKSYTHRRQERNYPTSIPTRRCFNSQASGDGLWWENEKILKNQRSISIDDFERAYIVLLKLYNCHIISNNWMEEIDSSTSSANNCLFF